MRTRVLAALLAACGCAQSPPSLPPPEPLTFPGPGRLAVIWHRGDPDDPPDRHLVIYDSAGARELPVRQPREVRWLGPTTLLALVELPAEALGEFSKARLLRLSIEDGRTEPLGEPRRYYNVEPAPDGGRFVVGVEVNDQGDSELELWAFADGGVERRGQRPQNLEEPRWDPEGALLAVAMLVDLDPDDDALALAVGGVTVPWPRLFALDGDLAGALLPIRDGGRAKAPVPGGSLPLWWSREGIYARQRQGLVRCASPESGCVPVFRNPPGRRLVDARPFGRDLALALLVDTQAAELDPPPSEIWRVDLVSGSGVPLRGPGAGAFPLDLDWTSD